MKQLLFATVVFVTSLINLQAQKVLPKLQQHLNELMKLKSTPESF